MKQACSRSYDRRVTDRVRNSDTWINVVVIRKIVLSFRTDSKRKRESIRKLEIVLYKRTPLPMPDFHKGISSRDTIRRWLTTPVCIQIRKLKCADEVAL